jgi:alkylhydroperoxidase family enzyme
VAFIKYLSDEEIPVEDRVKDTDNIVQIHSVHSKLMKRHIDLYRELMFSKGTLSRIQREIIAVVVSAENECHY